MPPITKPIAVWTSSAIASAIAITTATMPMIVYCRFRYAAAPSCTALEMACICSLPGDWASSQRVVTAP